MATLSLSRCFDFSGNSLDTNGGLGGKFKVLAQLDLSECWGLTDVGLGNLLTVCGPGLRNLNLSRCAFKGLTG